MIAFGREKRLILGRLALVAPLPLPFNEVIEPLFLLVYWVAVAAFLVRARSGATEWLPAWAMNLLALGYLPLAALDLSVFWRGQILRPLLHLALFTLVVKLFALRREADKWHALIGVFFVTLAAMGTSVHPTALLFLAVAFALHVHALARFAWLHSLAAFGRREVDPQPASPLGSFLAATTALSFALAIPLFTLLPRVSSPYLVAAGPATGTLAPATGFSDEIGLDAIGRLRGSRAVVLRFAWEAVRRQPSEPRFKAATYDTYADARWRRSAAAASPVGRGPNGLFPVADGKPVARQRIWLNPLGSPQLPLPVETVAVHVPTPALAFDRGGAAALLYTPGQIIEVQAHVGAEARSAAAAPGESEPAREGIPTAVADLAARAMGEGTPAERAARLERHLQEEYSYTLEFLGRGGGTPVEDFLLRNRRGHCELFATAMVLMLRAQGIPARLVTGFLGAEHNPLEGYWVVRQENRHAWVEAWIAGEGWRTFDPTPPAGRPGDVEANLGLLVSQVWDFVLFRWDRYVLTYGLGDQLDIAMTLRDLLGALAALWPRREQTAAPAPQAAPGGDPAEAVAGPQPPDGSLSWLYAAGLASLLVVVGLLLWRRRSTFDAGRAWLRLRDRLGAAGTALTPATPPVDIHSRLAQRWPEAAAPGARVLAFYLRESFGAEVLDAAERRQLRRSLRETLQRLDGRRREPSGPNGSADRAGAIPGAAPRPT